MCDAESLSIGRNQSRCLSPFDVLHVPLSQQTNVVFDFVKMHGLSKIVVKDEVGVCDV